MTGPCKPCGGSVRTTIVGVCVFGPNAPLDCVSHCAPRIGSISLVIICKHLPVSTEGLASVPYEYGAVASSGYTLFTAGACPLDEDGEVVAPGDHRAQAAKALENLRAVLDHYGASSNDLVKTTIYVVGDRTDLVAVWNVVSAGLEPDRPPSTLLGVAALGYQNQLVEIEGIAALSGSVNL